MQSWKEPVVQPSNSFHIISKYVWEGLKVDSPMTGLLQLLCVTAGACQGNFLGPSEFLTCSHFFSCLPRREGLAALWQTPGKVKCALPHRNQRGAREEAPELKWDVAADVLPKQRESRLDKSRGALRTGPSSCIFGHFPQGVYRLAVASVLLETHLQNLVTQELAQLSWQRTSQPDECQTTGYIRFEEWALGLHTQGLKSPSFRIWHCSQGVCRS